MPGQTKMIIITADEDIIRRFSFNKTVNTHIIDLNNDQPPVETSNENDNINMINLAFHTQSFEQNLNNDQIYKRSLDSPDQNLLKPAKTSRKSIDMICVICGDHAIGFNYDVLSCASCKAFFRRHANEDDDKIRCLTGRNQCTVVHTIRRKCQKCRLERCFAMGMRKDFIKSDAEKQRKRMLIEENRNSTLQRLSTTESTNSSPTSNSLSTCEFPSPISDEIDRLLMDIDKIDNNIIFQEDTECDRVEDILFRTLPVGDWLTIHSLQSSYVSLFESPQSTRFEMMDIFDRDSALISWGNFANQLALRFINFFRQINEFQDLDLDDRLILIKYNLLSLFTLGKCYNYKDAEDNYTNGSSELAKTCRRFLTLCGIPNTMHDNCTNIIVSLVEITEQNPILLSLLLIILILIPGLSMDEEQPPLKDSLAVNQAQSHYIKILWNYLVNQYGEIQACKRFTQLLTLILRMQSSSKDFRILFREQYVRSNTVDKITPLVQSVLNIS